MASLDCARDEFEMDGIVISRKKIIENYNKPRLTDFEFDIFCVIFQYLDYNSFDNLRIVNKELNKYVNDYFKHFMNHKKLVLNKEIKVKLNPEYNRLKKQIDNCNYDSNLIQNMKCGFSKNKFKNLFYFSYNGLFSGKNTNHIFPHQNTIIHIIQKINPHYSYDYYTKNYLYVSFLVFKIGIDYIFKKKSYKLKSTNIRRWNSIKSSKKQIHNIIIKHAQYFNYSSRDILKHITINQAVAFLIDFLVKVKNKGVGVSSFSRFINNSLVK